MSTSVEDANVTSPFNHDGWPVAEDSEATAVGHFYTGCDGSLNIIFQTAESAFFEGERHTVRAYLPNFPRQRAHL